MSNSVTLISSQSWTPEQLKLITDTVARGATPNELNLFLYRCKVMGLDPLKPGQIHFVKYGSSPGTVIVGIEGFRTIAHRTGKLSGIKRGAVKDESGKLTGGWAEVMRSDWTSPAREEAPLDEYSSGKGTWQKMPETMIKKVAEAAALRMAFPNELGGTYINEEEENLKRSGRIASDKPGEEDGVQEEGVEIPYGPLAKQLVHKADPVKLRNYVLEIEEKAKRLGKPIPKWAVPVIEAAEVIIGRFENQIPMDEELDEVEL